MNMNAFFITVTSPSGVKTDTTPVFSSSTTIEIEKKAFKKLFEYIPDIALASGYAMKFVTVSGPMAEKLFISHQDNFLMVW